MGRSRSRNRVSGSGSGAEEPTSESTRSRSNSITSDTSQCSAETTDSTTGGASTEGVEQAKQPPRKAGIKSKGMHMKQAMKGGGIKMKASMANINMSSMNSSMKRL